MATRMILIRHGDTGLPWGTMVGSTDSPLAEGALEKARELGERLKAEGIRALYSSKLQRAWKTAESIGGLLGLETERLSELNEVDFGEWEERFVGDVQKESPDRIGGFWKDMWNFRFPEGESFSDVRERALPVVEGLFDNHKEETFAVVAHGDVNAIIESSFTGREIKDIIEEGYPFLCALFFKKHDGKIVLEKTWGAEKQKAHE